MSLLNRDFSVPVCPRCNNALASQETTCTRCGYQPVKHGQVASFVKPPFMPQGDQMPSSERMPSNPNQSYTKLSQFMRPTTSEGQGTRLSQFAPPASQAAKPSQPLSSFVQTSQVSRARETDHGPTPQRMQWSSTQESWTPPPQPSWSSQQNPMGPEKAGQPAQRGQNGQQNRSLPSSQPASFQVVKQSTPPLPGQAQWGQRSMQPPAFPVSPASSASAASTASQMSFRQGTWTPQSVQSAVPSQATWRPQPMQTSPVLTARTTDSSPVLRSEQGNRKMVSSERKRKDSSDSSGKRALVYFTSVIVAIVILVFAVFHQAGLSLSSVITHNSLAPTATSYPLPKGTPVFVDSFLDDSTGWNLQSVAHNYAVSVGNGKLSLEDDKNSLLWEVLPGSKTYDNFTLTVNATLAEGDANNGYGVYIRGTANQQSDLATYYRFELYGDGSYAIFKGVTNPSGTSTDTKLTNYVLDAAIQKVHGTNRIMIVAKGASLSLIVNGQLLAKVTDTSYTSGSIALFVSNLPGSKPGAEAQFSQLAIYSA